MIGENAPRVFWWRRPLIGAEVLLLALQAFICLCQSRTQGHTGHTFFLQKPQCETDAVWLLTLDLLRCSLETFMREKGGKTDETLNVSPVEIMFSRYRTFLCSASPAAEKIVGTASSRSLTNLPLRSMWCSSKWSMQSTEKRLGLQSSHFMLASHFFSLLGLYTGNLTSTTRTTNTQQKKGIIRV